MNIRQKSIITFFISLIIAYFIVGYIYGSLVNIHWTVEPTGWDIFREMYIRTFPSHIIPAIIIALISTAISYSVMKSESKSD